MPSPAPQVLGRSLKPKGGLCSAQSWEEAAGFVHSGCSTLSAGYQRDEPVSAVELDTGGAEISLAQIPGQPLPGTAAPCLGEPEPFFFPKSCSNKGLPELSAAFLTCQAGPGAGDESSTARNTGKGLWGGASCVWDARRDSVALSAPLCWTDTHRPPTEPSGNLFLSTTSHWRQLGQGRD